MIKQSVIFIISASIIGIFSSILSYKGNPINTGICISCFMENYAGALKLHNNVYMQYLRPEITFIIIGSFISSLLRKEFQPRISQSIIYSFFGGFFMIVGSAIFIGCPIKMLLKLAGGDLNALSGIAGLISGVYLAALLLRDGIDTTPFTIKKIKNSITSYLVIVLVIVIFLTSMIYPKIFAESKSGAGAEKAPLILSIIFSLIIGYISQISRFCVTGATRNSIILKEKTGIIALFSLTFFAFITNIFLNRFNFGIYGQAGSHTQWLWSYLGMLLTGYIAVIIDGCPFRQLVKTGEGDLNAQIAFFGMLIAGAFVQNFNILSDSAGPTIAGKIWLLIGFIIFSLITLELRRNR
ncbi:MAG: YedE family putative selenium transporter [Proteobacteria bacterium]|nr:YedE family putative selenium transporter [Pseudomonadota bacterium]